MLLQAIMSTLDMNGEKKITKKRGYKEEQKG